MASKIHGKQIKDSSVKLVKIDPSTGQTLTLTGTSKIQQDAAPIADNDLTNKYYVDSVSAGFDPKESSRAATSVDLIGLGATYSATGGSVSSGAFYNTPLTLDGVGLTANDRILVKDQIDLTQNGLYVVVGPTATWYRTNDMDGTPASEVSTGNFSFVTEGLIYGGNGFVVISTGTWSGTLPLNIAPISWAQFSGGGSFIWGDGLYNIGNIINIDLAINSGLTVSSTKLTIDSNIAGTGLAWASGVLNVNLGTGLVFSGDNITVDYTTVATQLEGNGLTSSAGKINVNIDNGLSISSDFIGLGGTLSKTTTSINANGNTFSISNASNIGLTANSIDIVSPVVTINGYIGTNGQVSIDSSSQSDVNSEGTLIIQSYIGASHSKITLVGTGLLPISSDGSSNNMEVKDDLNAKGLVYNSDYSPRFTGNSLVNKFYVDNQIADVISGVTAGNGLTGGGTAGNITLDVNTGNGITILNDVVQLNQLVAGNGLTFSNGVIDINVAKGVTFSGDYLFSDAATILTTAFLPSTNVATNSTIQSALTAIDSYINGLQAATIISLYSNPSGTFLSTISTPVAVNSGVTFSRASDGEAFVFMNGVNYPVGSATSSDFFFANGTVYSGALTASNTVYIGQYLWSNVNTLGFDVDTTDEIIVKYNAI